MRIFLILLVFSIVVPKNIYAQSVGVDFDGDGRADVAGYEVQNDGSPNEIAVTWLSSSNNSSNIFEFGKRTETPVFSDYDGDGLTDAVVVGANEEGKLLWRYKLSSTPDESSSSLFGSEGDLIFFGCNFDGDSIADRAVLNDEGIFSYELSSDLSIKTLDLGKAGFERFLCADITGDGIDELVAQSSQSVKNKKNRKRRKKKKPAKSPSLANEKAIFHVWDLTTGMKIDQFEFGNKINGILAADFDGSGSKELAYFKEKSSRVTQIFFRKNSEVTALRLPSFLKISVNNYQGQGFSDGALLKLKKRDKYFKFASFSDLSKREVLFLQRTDLPLSTKGTTTIGPVRSKESLCNKHMEANDGPSGFLWKPVSDTTHNAVVALPAGLKLKNVRILKNGNTIENLRYSGVANGGRDHWRSGRRASSFDNLITITGSKSGVNYCWLIETPTQRYD